MKFDNHLKRRIKVFKKLLAIITLFVTLVALKNFSQGRIHLLAVEGIVIALGCLTYYNYDKWVTPSKFNIASILFTNTLCILLIYILFLEGFHSTGYFWLTTIPILSYMLNGLKHGLKVSFFYLSLATIALTFKEYVDPSYISFDNILDIVFVAIVVWVLAHFYESANLKSLKQLMNMALKDSLTGLNNRHAFYSYFETNKDFRIGVILIDLDFFKFINDNYGHDAGDFVLVEVAGILSKQQVKSVQAFRLGGEEFLIMAIDYDFDTLCTLANQILNEIREHEYVHEGQILELTASMGVHISDEVPSNLNSLMKYADYKLYEAKQTGRNKIICELPDDFDFNKLNQYT